MTLDYTVIITSIIGSLSILAPAFLLHKREIRKHKHQVGLHKLKIVDLNEEKRQDKLKLDFFNRAMDLSRINPIIKGVNNIFNKTIADRFLILIAVNGKSSFNIVSVIFEQHKNTEYHVNAIGTYKNVEIDDAYRDMLKATETLGVVELETKRMKDSILKDFYELEGVKHSKIRFLAREKIDDYNDFVIYSSLATHQDKPFSKRGKTIIKTTYEGNIIPNIKEVIK